MQLGETYVYPTYIHFDDCDPQAIAYHSQLIRYLDRARCMAMKEGGYSYDAMLADKVGVVIADMQLKFLLPLRYGTDVFIVTRLIASKRHSLLVHQSITTIDPRINDLCRVSLLSLEGTTLCAAIRLALVDTDSVKPLDENHPIFGKFNTTYEGRGVFYQLKHPLL